MLSPDYEYGDAFISRPYLIFNNYKMSEKWITLLKEVWQKRDVVLIEGEKSRIGVGNDLLDGVNSLKRILCPAENAFDAYQKIIDATVGIPTDTLILVSLGPTAKPLVYDLHARGYQAVDIGHIDMEYEMFIRKSHTLIPVKYKYFNEIEVRTPEDCLDTTYLAQITKKVK